MPDRTIRLTADDFAQMSVERLLILCQEDGVQGACEELDRRGVEPIVLPLGPEPVPLGAH